jgi:hypothetical protein
MDQKELTRPRSSTLMEIAQDAMALEQLIFEESGELGPTLEKWLDEVQGSLAVKVDHYHFAMQRFESSAEMLKKRAAQITAAARALENVSSSLKDRIKIAMETMGIDEVHGSDFRFKRTKGKDRVVIDEKVVSPEFYAERVVRELDKERFLEVAGKALLEKRELPAGIRFEPTFQLRSYVKKGG